MVTEERTYCAACDGEGYIAEWPNEGEAPEDAYERCDDCQGTGFVPPIVAPQTDLPAPF